MNSKVFLTPYGGVNKIGGNTFLLEDSDSKIIIDFGEDFDRFASYYEFPTNMPKDSVERELVLTGILPKILSNDGSMLFNYSEVRYDLTPTKHRREWSIIDGTVEQPFSVIISHGHLDHIANVVFLPSTIPIYTGAYTQMSFLSRFVSKRVGSLYQMLAFSENYTNMEDIGKVDTKNFRHLYKEFRNGLLFKPSGIEVKPYAVDHSIPGAFGFIIRTSQSTIAYTGDFRSHGVAKDFTEKFKKVLVDERVDFLICEGTNLGIHQIMDENDVESFTYKVISDFFTKGGEHVYISVSSNNIDRISQVYKVAKRLGVNLYMSDEVFLPLLRIMQSELRRRITSPIPPLVKDPFLQRKEEEKWGKIGDIKSLGVLIPDDALGELILSKAETLSLKYTSESDFSSIPSGSIVLLHDRPPLIKRRVNRKALFIVSTSEHESEEGLFVLERFINQAMAMGIPLIRVHSSGHINVLDLIDFVKSTHPKHVIPIHTEHPEFFKSYFETLMGIKVTLPYERTPISLER
ncbi:MAG: MBL fold metallo-hydrolase [Nitrososphaeria archaeon]